MPEDEEGTEELSAEELRNVGQKYRNQRDLAQAEAHWKKAIGELVAGGSNPSDSAIRRAHAARDEYDSAIREADGEVEDGSDQSS